MVLRNDIMFVISDCHFKLMCLGYIGCLLFIAKCNKYYVIVWYSDFFTDENSVVLQCCVYTLNIP